MKLNWKLGKRPAAAVLALTLAAGMCPAGMAAELTVSDSTISTAAEQGYVYAYAGLTWAEYWASEGVYVFGDDMSASSSTLDRRGEADMGAYDAVTRATTNHGLHRGSFQCSTVIYAEDGSTYNVSYWSDDGATLYLTDGTSVGYSKGTITKADGSTTTLKSYEILGTKYVPVAIKAEDYADFCTKYNVTTNDSAVVGGYSEKNLSAYSETAAVDANTNGLKTAVKNADGTYSFESRTTGSGSGLKDVAQQSVNIVDNAEAVSGDNDVYVDVQAANGSYGEFLRVDLKGNYGGLGAKMQAVRWDYYGSDSTRSTVLASYGTKFAADNWMHKSMSIQLGLTNSLRCQLPAGTDGTGYWTLTVYAMGYTDTVVNFEATADNIVVPGEDEKVDTTELAAAIEKAGTLNESDYSATSWAAMQMELAEAQEAMTMNSQAVVAEATTHLNNAINELVVLQKQTVKVKVSSKTYKASSLKKASKSFSIGAKAKSDLSYKVTKYPKNAKKYIKVSSKGKVTLKKGAKKGTYKVTVTAAENDTYKSATKTVTIKVK